MATVTPAEIILTYVKTYGNKEYCEKIENLLTQIEKDKNSTLLDDLHKAIVEMEESNDFKANFEDSKKTFIMYDPRKSATDKAKYNNYKLKSNKKALAIKAKKVMARSGVKMPYEHDSGIPKYQSITYARADRNEILGGDYVPKQCDDNEAQEKENIRFNNHINEVEIGTALFAYSLDVCAKEIDKINHLAIEKTSKDDKVGRKLIQAIKKKYDGRIKYHTFQQKTAEDKDNNKEIKLKYTINRVRIPVDQKNGKIGYQTKTDFMYPISDARKMAKVKKELKAIAANSKLLNNSTYYSKICELVAAGDEKYQKKLEESNDTKAVLIALKKLVDKPYPALVKVSGKLKHLDYKNSKAFLTYKSLCNLIIRFEGCLSTFGVSVNPKIHQAFVSMHKKKMEEIPFATEDMDDLDNGDDNDEEAELSDEDDSTISKKSKKSKSSKKNSDDEPVSDDEDDESDEEDSKKSSKPGKKKETKKEIKNESDDSDDDGLFDDPDIEKDETNKPEADSNDESTMEPTSETAKEQPEEATPEEPKTVKKSTKKKSKSSKFI
jgi:hypothetical protein